METEQRLEALEKAVARLVEQNDRFAEYLDERILREKESREFWTDVRKKLAVSGIWSVVVIVSTATAFGVREWFLN